MSDEKTEITKPTTDLELLTLTKKPCLIVMSGREMARKYPVNRPEVIIGRSSDAQIQIKEHNVSRKHVRIVVDGSKIQLEDLGSTNGTYVNSEKVTVCTLEEGDLISIGKTILKFSYQSQVDSAFHDEIYQSATNDELTGLYNRKYFQNHMQSEFARIERYGRDVSLIILDLDNFKKINDEYGHPAGDLVLRTVGKAIGSCVRQNVDIPARYGGEEFAILFPETRLNFAKKIGEKIRSKIDSLQMDYEGRKLHVTVSIGISSNGALITTAEALVRDADMKLYTAKRKGKNRVEA